MHEQLSLATALLPRRENDGPYTSSPERETAHVPRRENDGPCTSSRVYAIDPGQRKEIAVVCSDGTVLVHDDLLDFVKGLQPGDIVATESTFHVYRPNDRRAVIEAADSAGVSIKVMRSLFTSRSRKELWPDKTAAESKSDEADALAIMHYYQKKPNLFYEAKNTRERMGTINQANTPRFKLNFDLVSARREGYPGFEGHEDAGIAAAVHIAVIFGFNLRQFDRLCGFNAHGYPSLLRSNRNKHSAGKKPELRKEKMKDVRKRARKAFSEEKKRWQALQQQQAPQLPPGSIWRGIVF